MKENILNESTDCDCTASQVAILGGRDPHPGHRAVCPRVTLIMTSDPVDYFCFFLEMEFSSWYSSVPGSFCLELCEIKLHEMTSQFCRP